MADEAIVARPLWRDDAVPSKHRSSPPGRVAVLTHTSKVLKGNALGDPFVRPVHLWLPPQYDAKEFAERRFPVLFDLVGFMPPAAPTTT